MAAFDKINKQVSSFRQLNQSSASIETKLDELINLLDGSDLDSESLKKIHKKLNLVVEKVEVTESALKQFKALDKTAGSRQELVENLESLLSQHQLDSKSSQKILFQERLQKASLILVAILLITLGFSMIIMPAPPYFEMFTIFYFNPNDGVTLMDLIALLIVFTGVYLFITSVIKMKRSQ